MSTPAGTAVVPESWTDRNGEKRAAMVTEGSEVRVVSEDIGGGSRDRVCVIVSNGQNLKKKRYSETGKSQSTHY